MQFGVIVVIVIIGIWYACSCRATSYAGQWGGTAEQQEALIEPDSIVFSKKETCARKKNRQIKSFPLPLPLEFIKPPTANTSPDTTKELEYLSKLPRKPELSKLVLKTERTGVLPMFIHYAGENRLIYDEAHLKQVATDAETIAYLIKSYYNRPRPSQLGPVVGHSILPVHVSRSSSYPCEYTLIARVLADQLSYNNPEHSKELTDLAKKIEISRLYGGMNFPSDTEMALKIANVIKPKMKYLEG